MDSLDKGRPRKGEGQGESNREGEKRWIHLIERKAGEDGGAGEKGEQGTSS